MMNDANQIVVCPTIHKIVDKLDSFATENANVSMLSRTHGQVASPTTVGKEFANFGYRVSKQLESLEKVSLILLFILLIFLQVKIPRKT